MTTPNIGNIVEIKTTGESNDVQVASTKCDFITLLPLEIAQKILIKLSPEDLISAMSSCQMWKDVLRNDDYFWKMLCQRYGYLEVTESKKTEFYTGFLKKYNYWEGVFWYNHTVQRNWETNNYKEQSYLIPGNYFNYRNAFFLDDLFVITLWKNTALQVYNYSKSTVPIICNIVDDAECNFENLYKTGDYLIKFIPEQMLAAWDINDGSLLCFELLDHVTNIHTYQNLIVLETPNEKFEVFNIQTKKLEFVSKGIFKNVDIVDGRIVFTTMDQSINILKWYNKSLITFRCCNEMEVQQLLIKNNHLLSFCAEKYLLTRTLCVWNIVTQTKMHSISLEYLYDWKHSFIIDKYLCLYQQNFENGDSNYKYTKLTELWDYMKGTLAISVPDLDTIYRISNNRIIITSRLYKIGMLCVKTENIIDNLRIDIAPFKINRNVGVNDTKLLYVISRFGSMILYKRDFET